ncbi:MAG TPA: hypothetical protein VKZ88_00445 [Fibrobacteria bacterium]|nr:hypothetical protein [Fibrobacteria bacterium]
MIHWLQTSLFGRSPEVDPSPVAPAGEAEAPTSRPASPAEAASDPEFMARWESCGGRDIVLTLVPRLRQGWRMSWRRGGGAALRVPRVFRDAPDDILRALAAWAHLAMRRKSPGRTAERRAVEKTLHAWIDARHEADPHARTLRRGRAARRLARLNPHGHHHDLTAILAAITAEYFADRPEVAPARITWSARWGGLSTQSIAHDEHGKPYPLLSISRGYDHPSATPEIVGGVVYHECLHIVIPPEVKNGRRVVHGPAFRRREKQYRFYDAWRRWHAEKLPGIIRRGPR